MRPIELSKQLTTLDRDGICLAQQTGGAANLVINGAFATGGVATLSTQRVVGIFCAASLAGLTFTVTGTNQNGLVISESLVGPGAGATVSTVLNYLTVTRVSVNGAVGTDVEVGTTGVGATMPIPLDQYISPFAVALYVQIVVGTTVNVTVQYTPDDIFNPTLLASATGIVWTPHANLTSKTGDADSNIAFPASAVRLLVNSGTDAAVLIVRQAGIV